MQGEAAQGAAGRAGVGQGATWSFQKVLTKEYTLNHTGLLILIGGP